MRGSPGDKNVKAKRNKSSISLFVLMGERLRETNMSVKVKVISKRERIAVTVYRPAWREYLHY